MRIQSAALPLILLWIWFVTGNCLHIRSSQGNTTAINERVTPSSASSDDQCLTYRFPVGQRDPCAGYTCAFMGWCIPSSDLKRPTCVCYNNCFDVGDSTDKGVVCASDGVEYPSLCHLRRAACSMMIDLSVTYNGKCGKLY
ncbi:unnamed protein product [Protopolystoma xenopodis]|uniref:Kazal-like domain-containing protein n=1 Tax=Protopolystoma xenopodis TaxID=117903 RepID=A0A3S4ZEQ3_9PLAT|nr:unnamed protein product [Protopolystoma xenopodis]